MVDVAFAASWSGGKDSCLALHKTLGCGYMVKFLLNFISRGTKRGCFHGIESRLMQAQARAIGIPLVQKEVSPDMKAYEEEFKAAVSELKEQGIKGMVFGDIYLDEHRQWVERVCSEVGISPLEPLWNLPSENVLREFIDLGYKAVVVSAKEEIFEKDFVGRVLDADILKELKRKNICPCGENGEFHTFVVDGPLFKKRIEIRESEPVLKEGFWKHWFLDIKQFEEECRV
jgi:diphthine-ammonia ligase